MDAMATLTLKSPYVQCSFGYFLGRVWLTLPMPDRFCSLSVFLTEWLIRAPHTLARASIPLRPWSRLAPPPVLVFYPPASELFLYVDVVVMQLFLSLSPIMLSMKSIINHMHSTNSNKSANNIVIEPLEVSVQFIFSIIGGFDHCQNYCLEWNEVSFKLWGSTSDQWWYRPHQDVKEFLNILIWTLGLSSNRWVCHRALLSAIEFWIIFANRVLDFSIDPAELTRS